MIFVINFPPCFSIKVFDSKPPNPPLAEIVENIRPVEIVRHTFLNFFYRIVFCYNSRIAIPLLLNQVIEYRNHEFRNFWL